MVDRVQGNAMFPFASSLTQNPVSGSRAPNVHVGPSAALSRRESFAARAQAGQLLSSSSGSARLPKAQVSVNTMSSGLTASNASSSALGRAQRFLGH